MAKLMRRVNNYLLFKGNSRAKLHLIW